MDQASARLAVEKFNALLPADKTLPRIAVHDLDVQADLNADSTRQVDESSSALLDRLPKPEPLSETVKALATVAVAGGLTLKRATFGPSGVRDLRMRWQAVAGARAFPNPDRFAGRVTIGVDQAWHADPSMGRAQAQLVTSAAAHGDLKAGRIVVPQLQVAIDRRFKAEGRGEISDLKTQAFDARLRLKPISLGALLKRVPERLRGELPVRRLSGSLRADIHARGRLPQGAFQLMRLPLVADARMTLTDVGAALQLDAGKQLATFHGLNGDIDLQAKSAKLDLRSDLSLAAAQMPQPNVRIRKLRFPLKVEATPSNVAANVDLGLAELNLRNAGLRVDQKGLHIKSAATIDLPVADVLQGKELTGLSRVLIKSLALTSDQANITQAGQRIHMDDADVRARLDHRGAAKPTTLDIVGEVGLSFTIGGTSGKGLAEAGQHACGPRAELALAQLGSPSVGRFVSVPCYGS